MLKLDMEAFEPIPLSAQALQRSARAFEAQIRERDGDGNMNPKVVGHDLGMSDRIGTVEIGMPLHSAAESTSQNCQRQYGGHSGCRFIQIKTTTLDDAIGLRRASKACQVNVQACAIAPIDVLKIHVQGHEMHVLRGARRTLKSGL